MPRTACTDPDSFIRGSKEKATYFFFFFFFFFVCISFFFFFSLVIIVYRGERGGLSSPANWRYAGGPMMV